MVRCHGSAETARIEERISAALVALGLPAAVVSVRPVETLDRQFTGKLRRFIPLTTPAVL
jgi:hypothetical protein